MSRALASKKEYDKTGQGEHTTLSESVRPSELGRLCQQEARLTSLVCQGGLGDLPIPGIRPE